MNTGLQEPRKPMWAVAEVSWQDATGRPYRARATIEDTSASGACIRVKTPISVGSTLTIKWHREQFSGVARNCRSDGREFLLGIQRGGSEEPHETAPAPAASSTTARAKIVRESSAEKRVKVSAESGSDPSATARAQGSSLRYERTDMESKKLLPKFWRREEESESTVPTAPEEPGNKVQAGAAEGLTNPQNDLLSYEDIYHAAGILTPQSGYGIHKVVEMLNSERIRDLPEDIKRASVLMAIEAGGASVDELLRDATRRQQALESYEVGQQKQLEEFEGRKASEIAKIQAEMERVAARYNERIQRYLDQVTGEKEALRNWQMAKQHETQRIAEVIGLCTNQRVPNAPSDAEPEGSASPRGSALRPSLVAEAAAGRQK